MMNLVFFGSTMLVDARLEFFSFVDGVDRMATCRFALLAFLVVDSKAVERQAKMAKCCLILLYQLFSPPVVVETLLVQAVFVVTQTVVCIHLL